jgi:acyl-coenzyme A thioesterase PaaI-like protein
MQSRAIQEEYPEDYSYCYGCGRFNEHGLQIKSYWDGEEAVCTYTPQPYHLGIAGYVYGGLIASLIDCHCIGTAAAAYDAETGSAMPNADVPPSADAPPNADVRTRFVTAALHVDYLRPTPLGVPLEVRAHATEIGERKVVLSATLTAEGEVCARGEVVAVRIPEQMKTGKEGIGDWGIGD